MTREQVEKWLDKQIELDSIARECGILSTDVQRCGFPPDEREIHVWVKNGKAFSEFIDAIQPVTVTYNPNWSGGVIRASFIYKGYTVFSLLWRTDNIVEVK